MINERMVLIDVEASNKMDVLSLIANQALENGLITDAEAVKEALIEREEIIPTSVGNEIAIPHCKSSKVVEPFVGYLRLKESIEWSETEQARQVFCIIIPEDVSGQLHLQILAKLSRKLMHKDFVESLENSNQQEATSILQGILKEN